MAGTIIAGIVAALALQLWHRPDKASLYPASPVLSGQAVGSRSASFTNGAIMYRLASGALNLLQSNTAESRKDSQCIKQRCIHERLEWDMN